MKLLKHKKQVNKLELKIVKMLDKRIREINFRLFKRTELGIDTPIDTFNKLIAKQKLYVKIIHLLQKGVKNDK